jgi:conjugal transfer mating pair stabilization protein TraG
MWEIYAYQNSESLSGIFNAVAALMGSATYLSAIAAVAFCGFVAAALAYAFAPDKLQGWKWIAGVILVYSVLFVPKVPVGIVDKTGGAPVKVVANVPFGIAMFGGLTSSIGNTLTELFETAFQIIPGPGGLSSDFTYQKNGLLFGNRLIRDTRAVSIPDPNVRTDLVNFVHNCTMYDLVDGTLNPSTFAKSDDAWALMGTPNPARFTSITTSAGIANVTCPAAYANLSGRLPGEIGAIEGTLALRLNPTLPSLAATSAIAGQIQQAYLRNQISGAAASSADLIRQNAIINVINDSSQLTGQKLNDPASMVLAVGRAQSVAQQNASWLNGGKIAEQALPIVRNVIEAMTYALFPLFVLLLFLTSGRETMLALKSYVVVLIWIQLWPPLYAILNYMATIYAQYDLAAAAEVGGGVKALSLQTAPAIYANAISAEAVVGYLVASIPFIAWAALKRMETFGTAVVGGLSALQATVGASTGAAALGNVGLGNVTMDQRVISPSASNPWVARSQGLNGDWLTTDGTGRAALSKLMNEGFASRVVSVRASQQALDESSLAVDAARSEALSANRERSSVLADVLSRGTARITSSRSAEGSSSSSYEELGKSMDRLNSISAQVAQQTGLSQQQVQQIAFQLSASAGVGTPGFSPLKASASLGGTAGKSYSGSLSEQEQRVLASMSKDDLAEFKRFGDRVSRDASFVQAVGTDAHDGTDLSSRLAMTIARAERSERGLAERLAYAERISSMKESGEVVTIDMARMPENAWAQERYARLAAAYGPNSQALQVLLASELARQAPPPLHHFSDGSAVPLSFDSVRERHREARGDPAVNPDIGAASHGNDRAVQSWSRPPAPAHAKPGPSQQPSAALRSEVEATGRRTVERVDQTVRGFDQRNEITRNPDGTIGTGKSQVAGNARQMRDDVKNLGANVKEALFGPSKDGEK